MIYMLSAITMAVLMVVITLPMGLTLFRINGMNSMIAQLVKFPVRKMLSLQVHIYCFTDAENSDERRCVCLCVRLIK